MEQPKTGRPAPPKAIITHVEDAPCDKTFSGTHELTNVKAVSGETLLTFCEGCGESWQDLDVGLNGERR